MLVITLSERKTIRHIFEQQLSNKLSAAGLAATPSYTLLTEGEEKDKDAIQVLVRREGFDTVLITRLVGSETREHYIPGRVYSAPHHYQSLSHFYGAASHRFYSRGTLIKDRIVSLETTLYETKNDTLIWSVLTETFNPRDRMRILDELSQVLIAKLKADQLLPNAPSTSAKPDKSP